MEKIGCLAAQEKKLVAKLGGLLKLEVLGGGEHLILDLPQERSAFVLTRIIVLPFYVNHTLICTRFYAFNQCNFYIFFEHTAKNSFCIA